MLPVAPVAPAGPAGPGTATTVGGAATGAWAGVTTTSRWHAARESAARAMEKAAAYFMWIQSVGRPRHLRWMRKARFAADLTWPCTGDLCGGGHSARQPRVWR